MTYKNTIQPRIDFDRRLRDSDNVFADVFGGLTASEWLDTLIESIKSPTINGVEFPSFPPDELQSLIHGHAAAHSLREAASFYDFVRAQRLTGPDAPWYRTGYMLDFASGWGRILRAFMLDYPLSNIIGYEPNGIFCSVARSQNPFVSFVSGAFTPPTLFANEQFNLIVGWSIFSHLSEQSASDWLTEFSRILAPSGAIVMTTWGLRFLERLRREKEMLASGEDIHWYSKVCLTGSGDIDERIRSYRNGEFVWFDTGNSSLYGEAFLSAAALERIINHSSLPLKVDVFDSNSLAQDAFVLRSTKER